MGWRKRMKKFVVHRTLEISLHGEEMNWKIYLGHISYENISILFHLVSYHFMTLIIPFYDSDHTSEMVTLIIHLESWQGFIETYILSQLFSYYSTDFLYSLFISYILSSSCSWHNTTKLNSTHHKNITQRYNATV